MFFHYSIILFILKIRDKKPDQDNYDSLFFYIENNLREMGFGDVSVNKKMKDLNKIFYDILIKLNTDMSGFNMSKKLSLKYFEKLHNNDNNWGNFNKYFIKFTFISLYILGNNMIKDVQNYRF